jgi:SAM-dependent methyltransferase
MKRVARRLNSRAEGWRGWDEYAEFYDWENARTMGRRDLRFWQSFVRDARGPVLELGCGTGRVTGALARTGRRVVGVDRSAEMLGRAAARLGRGPAARRTTLVRGDITELPFAPGTLGAVVAPYGILQSLLSDSDLDAALREAARVLRPHGRFGLELVPDVPRWRETRRRVSLVGLEGPNGRPVTLLETVRQDRERGLTVFDHEFLEGTGRTRRSLRFTIRFRTVRVPVLVRRLDRAGFGIEQISGSYSGAPWSEDAETWILLAQKRGRDATGDREPAPPPRSPRARAASRSRAAG